MSMVQHLRFVVASERAISGSLGRQYGSVLALSYLDIYGKIFKVIMFVVASERAISCRMDRQYGSVLALSYLDIYGKIFKDACSGL